MTESFLERLEPVASLFGQLFYHIPYLRPHFSSRSSFLPLDAPPRISAAFSASADIFAFFAFCFWYYLMNLHICILFYFFQRFYCHLGVIDLIFASGQIFRIDVFYSGQVKNRSGRASGDNPSAFGRLDYNHTASKLGFSFVGDGKILGQFRFD